MRRLLVASITAVVAGVVASIAAGEPTGAQEGRWVIRDLGTLGGRWGEAVAINERGQIVGVSHSNSSQAAFVWQNGEMTRLPKLPRGGMCAPTAINDRGRIVGWCGGRQGEDRQEEHAVLWTWQPVK